MDFNKVQKAIYAIIGLFCIQISMKKLQSWPIIILYIEEDVLLGLSYIPHTICQDNGGNIREA